MGEFFRFFVAFFRGWRRNVGIVTLVMACAMLIASLRFINEQESKFAGVRASYPNHRVDLDGNILLKLDGHDEIVIFKSFSYVPDLFIAIPLTLLSACLLLSKPRSSTAMKITEPIRADGA